MLTEILIPFCTIVRITNRIIIGTDSATGRLALIRINTIRALFTAMDTMLQKMMDFLLPCFPVYFPLTPAKIKIGMMAMIFRMALNCMFPITTPYSSVPIIAWPDIVMASLSEVAARI